MPFVPDETIEQILDKVNIADLIGEHIPITKAGRNFKALCPFHKEKTPSFIISPDKGIFHCFGCGAGGNAIGFLMKYEGLEFPEAVKLLSEKTGVALPSYTTRDREKDSLAGRIYEVNETAAAFYQDNLLRSGQAKTYLLERGIDEDIIKAFRLGFAPDLWEGFLNFCRQKKIDTDLLEKAGLILPGKNESFYDRFRNRIMFPIFDVRGRILGFGARVMDDSLPKYINSPETPIYSKSRHLYGLNFSKGHIKKLKYVIIVEGYLDLITPYKYGVKNIVATLGTALTVDHIRLLKRFANTAVIIYDSDKAGEEASLRGLDLMLEEDFDVRIATLPPGSDPDSFVKGYGREPFYDVVKKSKNLFDYKLGLLQSRFNINDLKSKAKIASIMLPTIARISNAVLQSGYIKRLSERLSVPEEPLRAEMKKVKVNYPVYEYEEIGKAIVSTDKARQAEVMLLSIALEVPEKIDVIQEKLGRGEFREENVRQIFDRLFSFRKENKKVEPRSFLNLFEDERSKSIISEAVGMAHTLMDKDKIVNDCIGWIRHDNLKAQLNRLQEEIKRAEVSRDDSQVQRLVSQYNTLLKNSKD